MRPFSRWSIEWKLPLGAGLLLLVVTAVLTSAAYFEVRRATIEGARERLVAVNGQLVDMLEASARQTGAQGSVVPGEPALAAYLRNPNPETERAALAALPYTGNNAQTVIGTALWSKDGRQLLTWGKVAGLPDTRGGPPLQQLGVPDSSLIGRFVVDDSVRFPTVMPVAGGEGFLVVWRRVTMTAAGRESLRRLIGTDAALIVGNRDGTGWNDFNGPVAGPPAPDSALRVGTRYQRAGAGDQLGVARPIRGTPWTILVEFPFGSVTRPALNFFGREAAVAAVLWLVAIVVAWLWGRRITLPLRRLVTVADGLSADDFSRRTGATGDDELSRVGRSFDQMADRVQQSHGKLEDAVAERTRELHGTLQRLMDGERELSLAKEAAERANRAKSDFLAKMSHELRTPLNAVIGFSEVLLERSYGPLTDKQARYVGNVLTSGRQLLDLINDILDLSKVEAGRMELYLASVSVPTVIEEVAGVVAAQADPKRIRIEREIGADLPAIVVDPGKLKQIMYNLLSNAIKFTPEGGRVTVSASAGPGAAITVAVTDTGIGIRREDHERIFDEFEQIDSAYARQQQGTGLGLALTRKLVELHGGTIAVESEPGVGSTFRITLPVERRGAPRVGTPLPAATTGPTPSLESGPLVLIVEDDPSSSELLADYLKEAGFRAVETRSGKGVVALASRIQPDVITLDILLPDQHGHEVLAQLKADPATRDIPVVVVSITKERELGLSLGAADWLTKPTRREDFVASIRRAVGQLGTRTASALVIDDDPGARELISDLLSHQGFEVTVAEGAREGVDKVADRRFDVVVLDLVMPEWSGFEVARRIRDLPDRDRVPIVVFTMKDLSPEERAGLDGLVQAVVTKGRGRDALLREVERAARRMPAGTP